jgi:hypothetical protein
MPYEPDLKALLRMGAVFPPPGPTTPIAFESGTVGSSHVFGDEELRRALPHLRQLPRLELNLSSTEITNASIDLLNRLPNLRKLTVMDTEVTGAGLVNLRPRKALRAIVVDAEQVSDDQRRVLRKRLPNVAIEAVPARQANRLTWCSPAPSRFSGNIAL